MRCRNEEGSLARKFVLKAARSAGSGTSKFALLTRLRKKLDAGKGKGLGFGYD
jgi:hypothetical protein